jgi:hypothetical protein
MQLDLDLVELATDRRNTYSQIAQRAGLTYWETYRRARRAGAPLRSAHLSARQRLVVVEKLLTTNARYGEIAAAARCSRSTVCKIAIDLRRRQSKRAGDFQPQQLTKPRRCPVHGPVTIWPCVACNANGAKRRR